MRHNLSFQFNKKTKQMLYGAGFWTIETENRNQAIDEMSGQKTKTKNIYIHETYHVASG